MDLLFRYKQENSKQCIFSSVNIYSVVEKNGAPALPTFSSVRVLRVWYSVFRCYRLSTFTLNILTCNVAPKI